MPFSNLKEEMISGLQSRIRSLTIQDRLAVLALLVFAGIFFTMDFANHYYFRTNAFDYGAYNWAFWDFSHFRISPGPLYIGCGPFKLNFLQDHFSFTMFLFIPIYWLFNWLTGTYTLLLIQTSIILWSAWCVYKLVKLKTGDGWMGLGALFSYFLLQARFSSFSADCNLGIICVCFVPVFLYYFEVQRYRAALIVFIIALLSRENMALWFIFILPVVMLWHKGDRKAIRRCAWYMAGSLVFFVLLFKVFIPALEVPGRPYNLFNYSALGPNPFKAFTHILKHPVDTFNLLFQNPTGKAEYNFVKEEYYMVYLISGGFLLFLRPQYLIWFLPLMAQKMLNDEPTRWSIEGYYAIETATVLPIAIALIINDLGTLPWRRGLMALTCLLPLLVTAGKMDVRNRAMPWSSTAKENPFDKHFFHSDFDAKKLHAALNQLPPDASISASEHIIPQISQRSKIYYFPSVEDAEYLALFHAHDNYMLTVDQYRDLVDQYLFSTEWNIISEDPAYVILKKEPNKNLLFSCDAEQLNGDKTMFLTSGTQLLQNGINRSDEKAHSGKYSVKVVSAYPYGMTFDCSSMKTGELVHVSVWRYSPNGKGCLMASSGIDFSVSSDQAVAKEANGWELLTLNFRVPEKHQFLGVYVCTCGEDHVYFDDMQFFHRPL
jgi:uncharacterized membrane protein